MKRHCHVCVARLLEREVFEEDSQLVTVSLGKNVPLLPPGLTMRTKGVTEHHKVNRGIGRTEERLVRLERELFPRRSMVAAEDLAGSNCVRSPLRV